MCPKCTDGAPEPSFIVSAKFAVFDLLFQIHCLSSWKVAEELACGSRQSPLSRTVAEELSGGCG